MLTYPFFPECAMVNLHTHTHAAYGLVNITYPVGNHFHTFLISIEWLEDDILKICDFVFLLFEEGTTPPKDHETHVKQRIYQETRDHHHVHGCTLCLINNHPPYHQPWNQQTPAVVCTVVAVVAVVAYVMTMFIVTTGKNLAESYQR